MSARKGKHAARPDRAEDVVDAPPADYVGSAADAIASWSEIDLSVEARDTSDGSTAASAESLDNKSSE